MRRHYDDRFACRDVGWTDERGEPVERQPADAGRSSALSPLSPSPLLSSLLRLLPPPLSLRLRSRRCHGRRRRTWPDGCGHRRRDRPTLLRIRLGLPLLRVWLGRRLLPRILWRLGLVRQPTSRCLLPRWFRPAELFYGLRR